MTSTSKSILWLRPLAAAGLATALAFSLTACKANPPAPITNTVDNSGNNPADDGNLAPTDGSQPTQVMGQSASYTPQQSSESYQQAPAPIEQGQPQGYADQSGDDQYNSQDVTDYSTQPPPPLPEYDQPPAPDPDYLWTPGYWGWGDQGYYWVPGVWCPPPYYGALWTPPYWGFYGGRYGFHRGYWGLHVGFYGGVDYGFGYIGTGYWGGYWRGNSFYYNRSVNNIGFRGGNIYSRPVVYGGRTYGMQPSNRVSFNGGRGGIDVRPRPAEMAAMRESHVGPIAAQDANHRAAAANRGQLFSANHGRPAQTALARPNGVNGPARIAETPANVRQEQQRSAQMQQHNEPGGQRPGGAPNAMRPNEGNAMRPGANNNAMRPNEGNAMRPGGNNAMRPNENNTMRPGANNNMRPEQNNMRPGAPAANNNRPGENNAMRPQAPANNMRPEQNNAMRPQQNNAMRPQAPVARPQQEARPAPVERAPEARPAPQAAPRPAPEARPAPAARPAAPAPRPAAPAPRAAPAPHPAGGGGHEGHR